LDGLQLGDVVVVPESVSEDDVERGGTEHHGEDSEDNTGNLVGSFPRLNDTIAVKIDTSVARGGFSEVRLETSKG